MSAQPSLDPLKPRQNLGLALFFLGTGLPVLVLAHGLLNFGWCLAIAAPLGMVAGGIALSPAWAGALGGAVASAAAVALTQGWVALAGTMQLGAFQPRVFLFMAVPVILGFLAGFGLYALLRHWLGLPLDKPGCNRDEHGRGTPGDGQCGQV